ncbi:MAG: DUF4358 domain-containing protein [Oscillospiraceae bacterium]
MKKIVVALLIILVLLSSCTTATQSKPDNVDYVEQLNRLSASFEEFSNDKEVDPIGSFATIKNEFYSQYGNYPIINAKEYTAEDLKYHDINPDNLTRFIGEYSKDKEIFDTLLIVEAIPEKLEIVKSELEKRLTTLKENHKKHNKNPSLRLEAGQVLQSGNYLALCFVGIIPQEMIGAESDYVTGTADAKP